ncbi:MAG: phage baseplate protein [Bacteroidetes bacterium]|nr:phage baseplate protein [Bacteroidota bacterium]
MRSLTAKDIVGVWELIEHQTPIIKALTIIRAACPEMSADDIARLSIGERDRLLLLIRERMLGTRLESLAECPMCAERLEFTLHTGDLRSERGADLHAGRAIAADHYRVEFRLIDSYDLIDVATCPTVEEARSLLVDRAVVSATHRGKPVGSSQLPENVVALLAEAIADHDPQAEVLLNLDCPACEHSWQVAFDIATFLWDEVHTTAVELLRDVHFIAVKYGWSEEMILSMSATKRKLYLEM